MKIAIIGSGIAGMSCAWLLSQKHDITLFESLPRIGGHSNTVQVQPSIPVDTGFIVYNELTYPNLVSLFKHLGVKTQESNMSFSVSMNEGQLEYSGTDLKGLFAQKRNFFRTGFYKMLFDINRFYQKAPLDIAKEKNITLGDYLDLGRYSKEFINWHILPMGAAIWSSNPNKMRAYPAQRFISFFENHGLLKLTGRPVWRTVSGGSKEYIKKLTAGFLDKIITGEPVISLKKTRKGILVVRPSGVSEAFDHVVFACHADEAASIITQSSEQFPAETVRTLSAFRYSRNKTFLHTDASLMPRRKLAWASWNYLSKNKEEPEAKSCVTYWMNLLQSLPTDTDYFVTLNPPIRPKEDSIIREMTYTHPIFDHSAIKAQNQLGALQGRENLWFCGSYFGHGFHEDALASALCVAETISGEKRPWIVQESSPAAQNARQKAILDKAVAA